MYAGVGWMRRGYGRRWRVGGGDGLVLGMLVVSESSRTGGMRGMLGVTGVKGDGP